MPGWFDELILPGRLILKEGRWVPAAPAGKPHSWSFTGEWQAHKAANQQKTWDMTAAERVERFFTETQTGRNELTGKILLDAGCGNGQLTLALAAAGAYAVGIDRHPGLPAGNEKVQFVQDSFDEPPFAPASFDIIIANGSIHHTADTFQSFRSLAGLVKTNGKLYVWVYKKQKGGQSFLLTCLDLFRFFISRFPAWLQRISVNVLTAAFFLLSRIRKGENSKRSKDELRINIYDAFTPRYRHYHTTEEVNEWFRKCGFSGVAVTHDKNPYGFGMLGIKSTSVDPH